MDALCDTVAAVSATAADRPATTFGRDIPQRPLRPIMQSQRLWKVAGRNDSQTL